MTVSMQELLQQEQGQGQLPLEIAILRAKPRLGEDIRGKALSVFDVTHKTRAADDEITRKGKLETEQGMAALRGTAGSSTQIGETGPHGLTSTANSTGTSAANVGSHDFANTDATGTRDNVNSPGGGGATAALGSHQLADTSATGTRHHRDDAVTDVNAVPGQHDHGVDQPSSFNQDTAPSYDENKAFGEAGRPGSGGGSGFRHDVDQSHVNTSGRQTGLGLEGETAYGRRVDNRGQEASSGGTAGGVTDAIGSGNTGQPDSNTYTQPIRSSR
ncbi:hypothetical protein DXG01_003213 [Tephrocybe rancida]|nr:hypothetical protein DXG01_003213 [Tephrocybe rancida]